MGRLVDKPYAGGIWSKARFHSFIAGALRHASQRWKPKQDAKKAAKLSYGVYQCAGYGRKPHEARAKDIKVDHILPVVDPAMGFTTWDSFIERLFCEADNLQVLCEDCHNKKSNDEKDLRKLKS